MLCPHSPWDTGPAPPVPEAPSASSPAHMPLPRERCLVYVQGSVTAWVLFLDISVDGHEGCSVVGWWPSCGRGKYKGRWSEPPADPTPAGMGRGHAPPTSAGLLLTCFSSAHSPHHGWHRGHCWPVHPVVLWRLLHVSSYRKPQDGAGWGWEIGIACSSTRGLGVEMPVPLGAQHFTVCRVLLTSLGPLDSG